MTCSNDLIMPFLLVCKVIYAALEDVQMSVKRCAIEVLGKLDLPPDSQDRIFGITGSKLSKLENCLKEEVFQNSWGDE